MIWVKVQQDPQVHIKTGATVTVSDGGYERGYAAGYEDGLAARKHEMWTITLADGTIVEKEVALL